MSTATLYSLDRRLEVYAAADMDPTSLGVVTPARIVSYDSGDTWIDSWSSITPGTFTSPLAGAITGDSLDTILIGRGTDDRFFSTRLAEVFEPHNTGWSPIGAGVFTSKPAVCLFGASMTAWTALGTAPTSYAGVHVLVFGKGKNDAIWWAHSTDGAATWSLAWKQIGSGVFTSAPAAACSASGDLVAVFGRGRDSRMWWAFSTNQTASWDMAWSPIGAGVFTSEPAAACSADGKRLYVFARGNDNRVWWAFSTTRGSSWDMAWAPIGQGVFHDAPSASCSWDGRVIHVLGRGVDDRIWQARSQNFGASWDIAWRKISDRAFVDIDV